MAGDAAAAASEESEAVGSTTDSRAAGAVEALLPEEPAVRAA